MKTTLLPTALLCMACAVACTTQPTAQTPAAPEASTRAVLDSVTGTVTYRERIALAPDAVLLVQLLDVSRQGADAAVVASTRMPTGGRQVPLPFSLVYDTLRIDRTNTYAVQARLEAGGRVMFTNASAYPVITRGNPRRVQLLLQRAGQ